MFTPHRREMSARDLEVFSEAPAPGLFSPGQAKPAALAPQDPNASIFTPLKPQPTAQSKAQNEETLFRDIPAAEARHLFREVTRLENQLRTEVARRQAAEYQLSQREQGRASTERVAELEAALHERDALLATHGIQH